MKILYVTKEAPFGDIEAFVLPEIESHLRAGWDVFVCPVQGKRLVHEAGQRLLARTWPGALFNLQIATGAVSTVLSRPANFLRVLGTILKESGVRLIPRNLAALPKGLWLAAEVERLGIQHIHVHWIAVPATMAWIAASLANKPWSITAHRYDIAQRNMIEVKLDQAKFVRVIDQPGGDEVVAAAPRSRCRPVILHMGVELPDVPPGVATSGPPRAIIGARLIEKKGHRYVIEALAQARSEGVSMFVDVYGDGPLGDSLKHMADHFGVSDLLVWHGAVSHELLLQRLRSGEYRFGLLPSVSASDGDKEGIPVFLMEAMASGLPVITTPNGGIRELVDETCGVVVPEKDSRTLAQAVLHLADGAVARQLGACARNRIEEQFSIEAQMTKLRAMIKAEDVAQ